MVETLSNRKMGRYRVRMRVGGIRVSKSFSNLDDARSYEASLVRERERVRSGLGAVNKKILLIDYSVSWMAKRNASVERGELTFPSFQGDEKNLRLYILPYFAKRPIATITTLEWKNLIETVVDKEKLSPATHNRIRSTAHSLYADAIADGIVAFNPISGVPRKSEQTKTRKTGFWETDNEILAYLEAAEQESPSFKMFAYIALNTGARIAEICAIQNCDVELDHKNKGGVIAINKIYEQATNTIQDRTKSGKSRYVPINPVLFEKLIGHMTQNRFKKPTDFLTCRDDGSPVSPDQLSDIHERVIKNAGVRRITPHDLRRTFATKYRRDGGPKDDLQVILGHSSSLVTDTYAKTTKESVRKMGLAGIGIAEPSSQKIINIRGET